MKDHGGESAEVLLREASELLQLPREYSGIPQDPYPRTDKVERLFVGKKRRMLIVDDSAFEKRVLLVDGGAKVGAQ